ncbi:hypothetical protein, partial [Cronobacter sakazakii]|uniref:hypothetical protein n=1 Tax=Cronobacter sakazakii TaxID=28141 RepID=UPI00294B55E9
FQALVWSGWLIKEWLKIYINNECEFTLIIFVKCMNLSGCLLSAIAPFLTRVTRNCYVAEIINF